MKLITRETMEEFRSFSEVKACCLGKQKSLLVSPIKCSIQIARYFTHVVMWPADYMVYQKGKMRKKCHCNVKTSQSGVIGGCKSIPPTSAPNTSSCNLQIDVWHENLNTKANILSRRMNKLRTPLISKNNFTKSYPSVTVICTGLPVDNTCSISALGQSPSGLLWSL